MSNPNQLGLADQLLSARSKTSKEAQQLQPDHRTAHTSKYSYETE